jgi:hypothetical protein
MTWTSIWQPTSWSGASSATSAAPRSNAKSTWISTNAAIRQSVPLSAPSAWRASSATSISPDTTSYTQAIRISPATNAGRLSHERTTCTSTRKRTWPRGSSQRWPPFNNSLSMKTLTSLLGLQFSRNAKHWKANFSKSVRFWLFGTFFAVEYLADFLQGGRGEVFVLYRIQSGTYWNCLSKIYFGYFWPSHDNFCPLERDDQCCWPRFLTAHLESFAIYSAALNTGSHIFLVNIDLSRFMIIAFCTFGTIYMKL